MPSYLLTNLMKKTFLLLFAVAALTGCNQSQSATESSNTTAPTLEGEAGTQAYGAAFAQDEVLSTAALHTMLVGKDSVQATVTAEIVSSCQAKGCWMDVQLDDSSTMKVTFRDYGFFVPVEDISGRTVVFTGTAKKEVTSVEDLRHHAEDAGRSKHEAAAITQPKEELKFVADGVVLKD